LNTESLKNHFLIKLVSFLRPPDPSYHYQTTRLKQLLALVQAQNGRIADVGSGGRRFNSKTISVDIHKQAGVNVVADASALPFKSQVFKMVVNTALLEHVKHLNKTLAEVRRILATGGWIYTEAPFLQSYHAHPSDYRRFTLTGLEHLFEDYHKESSGVCIGPFSTCAWIARKLPRFLLGGGVIGLAAEFFVGWLTFWIKYLDALLPENHRVHEVANGLFFIGLKKN
jgi:SAM-dependent methyltransferase